MTLAPGTQPPSGQPSRVWRSRLAAIGVILVGIALRIGWLYQHPSALAPSVCESQRVGVSLATTGRFADAFRIGSGPTAHLSPLTPSLTGLIYHLAGVGTPAAEWILALLSIGLISLSFGLTFMVFGALGAPRWGRFLALGIAALVPFQFNLEARELKVWEAPVVVSAIAGLLLWVLALDRRARVGWWALLPIMVAAALLFLFSPPASLAAFLLVAVITVRRVPLRQWLPVLATSAVVLVLVTLPWALRNRAEFGHMIFSRSDPGLELNLAFNDQTAFNPDRKMGYISHLNDVDPVASDRAYNAMVAGGGEALYAQKLGVEAKAWMRLHPRETVSLILRHVRQYIVPPAWFFETWGRGGPGIDLRRFLLGAITLTAFVALMTRVFRDPRYLYVGAVLGPLVLPYIVVQPILRYRYLVATLLVFIACDGVSRLIDWARIYRRPIPERLADLGRVEAG
jgi:4-amino-4-deoxy-L-arabinose transferase-like glycosyltransferase